MTHTVSGPIRTWAATHRVLLAVVAAVVLAATMAIILVTSSGTPARGASTDGPVGYPEVLSGQSVPTDEDDLSPTEQACQLARVAGC